MNYVWFNIRDVLDEGFLNIRIPSFLWMGRKKAFGIEWGQKVLQLCMG